MLFAVTVHFVYQLDLFDMQDRMGCFKLFKQNI